MAVDAQLGVIGRQVQEFFLICSMRVMATLAVAIQHWFVRNRFGKLYLCIHMTCVASGIHSGFEHARHI
jgi:hypothetical protein